MTYITYSYRTYRLIRPIFGRKKEPHFSSVRSVLTVDAPEGRVASVAIKNCLRSTALNYERTLNLPTTDPKTDRLIELTILDILLNSESISGN